MATHARALSRLTPSGLALLLLVGGGCATGRVDVFNLDGSRAVSFHDDHQYQDVLFTSSSHSDLISHMFLTEAGAPEFRLVERNSSGVVVRDTSVPRFTWDPAVDFFAMRPDGRLIAYERELNLYVYDFDSREEKLLVESIASNPFDVAGMVWRDDDTVVVLLDGDRAAGRAGQILCLDVRSGRTIAALELDNPRDPALTPSGRLLAVTQIVRGSGIQIIDLSNLAVVAAIPATDARSWMTHPAWNPAGDKLVYVDAYKWLTVYRMSDRSSVRIAEIQESPCYFLGFASDDLLIYRCGKQGSELTFYDLASRRVVKTLDDRFGTCLMIADGTLVACGVGF